VGRGQGDPEPRGRDLGIGGADPERINRFARAKVEQQVRVTITGKN